MSCAVPGSPAPRLVLLLLLLVAAFAALGMGCNGVLFAASGDSRYNCFATQNGTPCALADLWLLARPAGARHLGCDA